MSPKRALAPAVLAIAAAIACAAPAGARELWRDGDRYVDFSGSLRELALATHDTDANAFESAARASLPSLDCIQASRFHDCAGFRELNRTRALESSTRLRLRSEGRVAPGLSYEVAYDQLVRAGQLGGLFSTLVQGLGDTFLGAEHVFTESTQLQWSHALYRGWLRYELAPLEVTVGRQRIAWGVTRFWNPMDRFDSKSPLDVEPQDAAPADAVDLRWRFGGFDYAELVYAPGPSRDQARFAARLAGVVHDFDVSVMAGSFDEAVTAGADIAGNLGDASFGLEAVFADPHQDVWPVGAPHRERLDPFWQVVAFVDINLDVGEGIYLLVEHLYDGNALGFGRGRAGPALELFSATDHAPAGVPASLGPFVTGTEASRFGGSTVVSFGQNLTAFQAATDLLPSLRGDLIAIYDWQGSSAAFYPTLTYTGFNALDLTLGVQVFAGPFRSQFGWQDPLYYVRAEFFF